MKMNHTILKRMGASVLAFLLIIGTCLNSTVWTQAEEASEKTIISFTINEDKTQYRYLLGETIETSKFVLDVVYSDNSKASISADQLSGVNITASDTTQTLDKLTKTYGIHSLDISLSTMKQTFGIMIVPDVVTGLKEESATTDSIKLSWNQSVLQAESNPNNYQLGYQIMAYNADGKAWTNYVYGGPSNENLPSTTTSHELTAKKIEECCTIATDSATQNKDQCNKYKIRSFYKVYYEDGTKVPANFETSIKVDTQGRQYVACYSNRSEAVNTTFAPKAPDNLQLVESTSDSVSVKWDALANVNGYYVYRATVNADGTTTAFEEVAQTTELQYTDRTIAGRTNYQYKVKAYIAFQSVEGASELCTITGEDSAVLAVSTKDVNGQTAITKITVDKKQSKYQYIINEQFSGEGIVVSVHYADGTTRTIAKDEYQLSPKSTEKVQDLNQITATYGTHKIHVEYVGEEVTQAEKESGVNGVNYEIYVRPNAVQNVKQTAATKDTVTLSWDMIEGVSGYQIMEYNPVTNAYDIELYGGPKNNNIPATEHSVTLKNNKNNEATANKYFEGQEYRFKVRAFYKDFNDSGSVDSNGKAYRNFDGEMSEEVKAVTIPSAVSGLAFEDNTDTTISLRWNEVASADGYIVYACKEGETAYQEIGQLTGSLNKSCTCSNLLPDTVYLVKVVAYKGDKTFVSEDSPVVKMMTQCNAPTLSVGKCGSSQVVLNWSLVEGADGYHIYQKQENGAYELIESVAGESTISQTIKELKSSNAYTFKVCAYKDITTAINGVDYTTSYNGKDSNEILVTTKAAIKTSTKAALYSTKAKFQNSDAYKKFTFFKKYLKYKKCINIPGLKNTNVGGYSCETMQAKAVAFMDGYVLISASDLSKTNNSVIYVVDQSSKSLLTTLCLKDKANVSGMAYDGKHVWLTNGKYMAALSAKTIKNAANKEKEYTTISYETKCTVKTSKPAYATYYGGKLWVGSSSKSGKSVVYSYQINNKNSSKPSLVAMNKFKLASNVKGISFLNNNTLYVSRSYGANSKASNYTHTLEMYQLKKTDIANGKVKVGAKQKSITVPSLNAGIAVDSGYLYVSFSSVNVEDAYAPVDRICALKWR